VWGRQADGSGVVWPHDLRNAWHPDGCIVMHDAWNELDEPLKSPEFLSFAAARSGLDQARVARVIYQYTAEVAAGARTVAGIDLNGKRILEVGAGIGVLSICLARQGYRITALEPGANGFDANAQLGAAVRAWLGEVDLPMLDIEVGRLNRAQHGEFDLIFSINVLEHIPDLAGAMAAMEGVLAPSGSMIHLCPNYAIPYEPHFGIPLVPLAPRLTALLFPSIARDPTWPSLNFVTYRQIRRLARRSGLSTTFRPAMMYDAFARLEDDEEFRARHSGLVARLNHLLKRTRVLGALRHVPPALATPMAFECRRVDRR
jgi:2-polyprenyl-3-methyl-5-hydroxy-6-metoxy-1,4-benzoquinol methylase